MSADDGIGLVLAAVLLGYLVAAFLVRPRYFVTEPGMGYRFEG